MTKDTVKDAILEEQELRSKMRESFLRSVSALTGESCSIMTYEKSRLNATFSGWKPDGTEVLVTNLQTPAAVELDAALLRTPDILYIHMQKPIELP